MSMKQNKKKATKQYTVWNEDCMVHEVHKYFLSNNNFKNFLWQYSKEAQKEEPNCDEERELGALDRTIR